MKKFDPLITVIVPVYNVEKYIDRCVNSLLKQTYKNLEIILVDDGSQDNSGVICESYSKKNERIKTLHKKNGGLSSARNFALDKMKGEYVTFIDSDDFVSELYIEKLFSIIKKYNADIAVCDENRFVERDEEIVWTGSPYKQIAHDIQLSPNEGLETYMRQVLYDASACMKLYKSSLFNNIRYPEGYNYEDVGTTYKLYCKAKNTAFTPNKLYYYFQREDSILHTKNKEKLLKNLKDGIKMVEEQKKFVSSIFPELWDAADCRCFSMYCRVIGLLDEKDAPNLYNYSWEKIKKSRYRHLTNRKNRNKVKIAAFISIFGKKNYINIYNLFSKKGE